MGLAGAANWAAGAFTFPYMWLRLKIPLSGQRYLPLIVQALENPITGIWPGNEAADVQCFRT
jgi:hypothetical protein